MSSSLLPKGTASLISHAKRYLYGKALKYGRKAAHSFIDYALPVPERKCVPREIARENWMLPIKCLNKGTAMAHPAPKSKKQKHLLRRLQRKKKTSQD